MDNFNFMGSIQWAFYFACTTIVLAFSYTIVSNNSKDHATIDTLMPLQVHIDITSSAKMSDPSPDHSWVKQSIYIDQTKADKIASIVESTYAAWDGKNKDVWATAIFNQLTNCCAVMIIKEGFAAGTTGNIGGGYLKGIYKGYEVNLFLFGK